MRGPARTGDDLGDEVPRRTVSEPLFLPALGEALGKHGFRRVDDPDSDLLLKRQNFNTNRAVVVVSAPAVPEDFGGYVREVRSRVATRCRYIPVLWPVGIQFVAVAPGFASSDIDPTKYIALVDNQWALIQSMFLVDPERGEYRSARTWGQFITGKFQDAITAVLNQHYRSV
jgi:hypothetical protein